MKKELYYEEEGEENKEIIIFIHSNLLSNWVWKKQRNHFNDYHCIYIDLPEHGNSQFGDKFSIKESAILIKELIAKKGKNKKVNLVGIAIGGQIILEILANYPEIVKRAIITGTYISKTGKTIINRLHTEIVEDKPINFMVKAYLAEYGIGREYSNHIKESINSIDNENLIAITQDTLKFQLKELENKKIAKELLVLYGTKEYPKIAKSARIIENSYLGSKIYGVYRAIHLWNIIDYEWFNDTVHEFLKTGKLDLNKKPYLKINE